MASKVVGILLDRKQLKIEGSFGEPDERDGDHASDPPVECDVYPDSGMVEKVECLRS